jgi:hypothetical protein
MCCQENVRDNTTNDCIVSKDPQTTSPKPKKMTKDYTNELNISR